MTAANRYIFGRATRRKPRFLAFPKTPLFNHLWVKTSFFQEKTRFSGWGVPPRRAAACTSGERGSDGRCARSRENGAPNRPIWHQLLLLRAYGTARPTTLARFVACSRRVSAPPPPKVSSGDSGGGGMLCLRYLHGFWHFLGPNRRGLELLLHTVDFWTKNIFCPNGHVLE